jgi:hypothetical protein
MIYYNSSLFLAMSCVACGEKPKTSFEAKKTIQSQHFNLEPLLKSPEKQGSSIDRTSTI